MKKVLSVFLSILLIVAILPLGAFNLTASALTEGYYTYTVENGKATITDVDTEISGDITIPSTLGGYPVICIGGQAFSSCKDITSVVIGKYVTSIGAEAFISCLNLVSVTIPESLTNVGHVAFIGCDQLKSVYINDLKAWCEIDFKDAYSNPLYSAQKLYVNNVLISGNLVIPEGITKIGSNVFCYYTLLTGITIPNSVKNIGICAFQSCPNIVSINIGTGVTNIGQAAFHETGYYNNLNNWQNGVLYISNYLIEAKSDISGYCEIKEGTVCIADAAFECCRSLSSVKIPNSVTNINEWAFGYCDSLESIIIGDSVESIGEYAFYRCISLTNIRIPKSVVSMGSWVFGACNNLTSATLDNGVKTIGAYQFYNCTKLVNITIPNSVTSIGTLPFLNCNIQTVNFIGTKEEWKNMACSQEEALANAQIVCICNGEHSFDGEDDLTCNNCDYAKGSCGDVNNSGATTLDDVVVLAQVIAGWQGVAYNEAALDVNRDGSVTLDDVVLLAQFVAGWDVTLS